MNDMDKHTHFQVFQSLGEDNEVEVGVPLDTEEEAVSFADAEGLEYFLIYPCHQVTAGNGKKWWYHARSSTYMSF